MSTAGVDVEYIVREVMRRLREMSHQSEPPRGGSGSSPPTDTGKLVVADRVVTLATLEGRLEGVRSVVVQTKAVITPAVKDELRTKKIDIARCNEI